MNDSRFNSLKTKKPKNNRGRNWVNLKNIEDNNPDEHTIEAVEPNFPNYEIEPTYDTDELDDEDIIDIDFDDLVQNSNHTNESTNRLAVLHFDFEHYPLSHLANIVKSFIPSTGKIKSVIKYPTEEYMDRYEEDISNGPKEYINHDSDIKPYKTYRKYQISRLKFFLTVFEFDSIETADIVYNDLDGQSLGDSGLKLDLRYVSADRQFDIPDRFKHLVEKLNPNLSKFKSVDFKTSCFATTAVKDDWDIDHKREEANLRAFQESDNEVSDNDYFATDTDNDSGSDSSDDNESDNDSIADTNNGPIIKPCKRKRILYKQVRELLELPLDEIEQESEHEDEQQSETEEQYSESDKNEFEFDENTNEMSNSEHSESEEEEKETKPKKISQRLKKKLILKEKAEKKQTELREKREYLKSIAGSDVVFDKCKHFLSNPHLYKIDRNHPKYLNALLQLELVHHCATARGISVNVPVPDFSEFITSSKRSANGECLSEPKNKKIKI